MRVNFQKDMCCFCSCLFIAYLYLPYTAGDGLKLHYMTVNYCVRVFYILFV